MLGSRVIVALVGLVVAAAVTAAAVGEPTAGLTLVGALVVALVTAEAADTRQTRQLAAEAERHAAALKAEGERHRATLEHARVLADLEDVRALLDEAAVALHRGDQAIGGVDIAYTQFGRSMDEGAPDARPELNARGRELDALGARLSVRLGSGEEAVQAFRAATDAALEVSRAVGWLADDRPQETQRKHATIDAQRENYTEAARRFIVASVEIAGTQRLQRSIAGDERIAPSHTPSERG